MTADLASFRGEAPQRDDITFLIMKYGAPPAPGNVAKEARWRPIRRNFCGSRNYRKHLEPMRVLVVDDDPEILEVVAFVLDAAGFRILQASSGEECVRVAIAEQPEIILMDKQMPGMDGKAAAALLAGHIETRNIPILMMTHGIEDGDRIAALATEGVDLLTKPLSMSEVVAKVVSIARRKAYRDEAQTGRKELLAGVTTQTHQLQSALEAFSKARSG